MHAEDEHVRAFRSFRLASPVGEAAMEIMDERTKIANGVNRTVI